MATLLYRVGRFCGRRSWLVIAAWVLVLAVLGGAASAIGKPLSDEITIPGAGFQKVLDHLEEKIPEAAGGIGTVVLTNTDGSAFTDEQKGAINDVVDEWARDDAVASVRSPFAVQQDLESQTDQLARAKTELSDATKQLADQRGRLADAEGQLEAGEQALARMKEASPSGSPEITALERQLKNARAQVESGKRQLERGQAELGDRTEQVELQSQLNELSSGLRFVSEDGSVAMTQIQFDRPVPEVDPEIRHHVMDQAEGLTDVGVRADFGTEISQDTSSIMGPGEVIGLVAAAIVLIVMLGTLLTAGLPILNALFGVGVGLAGALALTSVVEMNTVTPALALMLGLAVGIDYALFIVNRHREQLLLGTPVQESIGRATGTAGNAVIVAGTTVFIALAALTVTGIPFLGVMGLVAAGTVACAVLVSVTLTPAVLGLLGTRALSRRTWARHGYETPGVVTSEALAASRDRHHSRGVWGRIVTRRPWFVVVGVSAVLVVLAIPLADLRLGLPDGSSEPASSSAYRAYSTIEDHFGAGANGPLLVVGTVPEGTTDRELLRTQVDIGHLVASSSDVEAVVPVGTSEDNTTFAFQVLPTDGPSARSTVALVHNLEDAAETRSGVELGFTGQTVANIEISERLGSALPLYLLIVVGLSVLLLTLVFRSMVVPLLATGGFLLSIAASFGAAVAVYQWGWAGDVFGVTQPGPILSFMPTLLIGVLFGLAMDYQMFLVTGMHEAWAHGEDARTAVLTGFSHAYRVVTAAAIIMISVFAGFIHAELTMIRPIGFGLAIGVLIDAFLVRMTLTPAALYLLGERTWGLPRWLDRLLPNLDVEGARLTERLRQGEPGETDHANTEHATTGA